MLMCNQYESQSETTNKGEGLIGDKDPHEKEDYNSRGSARVAMETEEQRQLRREQVHINLERQGTE